MPAQPYLLHRRPHKSSLRHVLELSGLTLSFALLSCIAVFTSLGYHINTQARTIERSGGVVVAVRNNVSASVSLDGVLKGVAPLRIANVRPGTHVLAVSSERYQTFTTNVVVVQGDVTAFRDIFLILTTPTAVTVDPRWLPIISVFFDPGVQIKSGNELWRNEKFLTRTSGDILQARYSNETRQIFYQEGDTLWMYTPSSQTTVQLLKATSKALLPFDLRENSRILVYEQPIGTVQALALY